MHDRQPALHASAAAGDAGDTIETVEALEALIGARPDMVDLKVIDHLDAQARRWIAASPLAFAGFGAAGQTDVTLAGGAPGFASVLSGQRLRMPRALLDDPRHARPGCGVGLLFLIPGLGETLRVNGTVETAPGSQVLIAVQECYAHCAKALLRSDFWQPTTAAAPADTAGFLAACRFMALATADAGLRTDVSPKGDPAGLLARADEDAICFADRPGNRRTDSFRNLLARPHAAAALVVPGCAQVVIVRGDARLTADARLRQAFTVQDKTPKLVTRLLPSSVTMYESIALARATPWASPPPPPDIDPAEVFAAHVRLNKTRGLRAALAKGAVSIPGLMRKGLKQDYKRNMY
ncbi:pyridoxamine 5'-phosphate oxidase family protein [Achromobacter aloeverae]